MSNQCENLDPGSDRRRIDEDLLNRESPIHRFAESCTIGVWSIDARGCTTYVNPRVEELTGYSLVSLRHHCVFELLGPDSQTLRTAVQSKEQFDSRQTHEFLIRRKDGDSVWLSVAITPMFCADGAFDGALCLLTDITEQKQAQEALRRSEHQFRLLSENATDVIVRLDRDFRIGHINRSIMAVTGQSPAHYIGKSLDELDIDPERAALYRRHVQTVFDTGRSHSIEFEILTIGGPRSFQATLAPELDDEGNMTSCLCIGRDVTERTQMLERQRLLSDASVLLSTSLEFEVTIQSITRMVVPELADACMMDLRDDDGTVRRIAAVHNDPEKEALLFEIRRLYPFLAEASYGIPRVIATGKPEIVEQVNDAWLESISQDAEQLRLYRAVAPVSMMSVPLTARDRTMGALTLMTSESGRIYTQEDLELASDLARRCALAMDNARLFQEVRQVNQSKDEFLALLSHELRNPLAAIRNALRVMDLEGDSKSVFRQLRADLEQEVHGMTRLVEDLLDVARITRGQIHLRPEPLDMGEAVMETVEKLRPLIRDGRNELEVALESEGVHVHADPVRLQQVVSNLLENAVKYTPPGGRIRLSLGQDGGLAVMRVRDNGIGIQRDEMPMLFRSFYQARPEHYGEMGLGLGLPLVRRIVEMHGGRVSAHSDGIGQGTEFVVHWPLAHIFEEARNGEALEADGSDEPEVVSGECEMNIDTITPVSFWWRTTNSAAACSCAYWRNPVTRSVMRAMANRRCGPSSTKLRMWWCWTSRSLTWTATKWPSGSARCLDCRTSS